MLFTYTRAQASLRCETPPTPSRPSQLALPQQRRDPAPRRAVRRVCSIVRCGIGVRGHTSP